MASGQKTKKTTTKDFTEIQQLDHMFQLTCAVLAGQQTLTSEVIENAVGIAKAKRDLIYHEIDQWNSTLAVRPRHKPKRSPAKTR